MSAQTESALFEELNIKLQISGESGTHITWAVLASGCANDEIEGTNMKNIFCVEQSGYTD